MKELYDLIMLRYSTPGFPIFLIYTTRCGYPLTPGPCCAPWWTTALISLMWPANCSVLLCPVEEMSRWNTTWQWEDCAHKANLLASINVNENRIIYIPVQFDKTIHPAGKLHHWVFDDYRLCNAILAPYSRAHHYSFYCYYCWRCCRCYFYNY